MPQSRYRRLARSAYWALPCLVYLYAAGRAPHAGGMDLLPSPDAQEYALLAGRLAAFKAPLIAVGLNEYPSRYSLAYPLLLTPFAWIFRGDTARFFWSSVVFGLATVILIVRAGRWMLGSRLAGAVAALLWALHPQTIWASTVVMSEIAVTTMFFVMLELARPWLIESRREPGAGRAAALGLALGWLTLAKAPFAYWALALAALAATRAIDRRRFGPLAALLAAGLACAIGDGLYRRWAFGFWGADGYAFWFPPIYQEFLRTFHWKYLFEPWMTVYASGKGNLAYYGEMLLGRTHDFYSPYMAVAIGAAAVCLAWPWRRGRPGRLLALLLGGWFVVGLLFCGFYFYQSTRFPHLWVPALDLLVAWGLVRVPDWVPLRRGWARRARLRDWARVAALLVALFLVRGEWRRVWGMYLTSPARQKKSYVERLRPLLASVPQGAWLFANYEPPLVDLYRPTPGPVSSLYTCLLDYAYMNGHVFTIESFGLRPRRPRPEASQWLRHAPRSWENGPAQPIGLDRAWKLTPEEGREIFGRPAWLLIVRPAWPTHTGEYLDRVVMPLLERELRLEAVARAGEATLYRAVLRVPQAGIDEGKTHSK